MTTFVVMGECGSVVMCAYSVERSVWRHTRNTVTDHRQSECQIPQRLRSCVITYVGAPYEMHLSRSETLRIGRAGEFYATLWIAALLVAGGAACHHIP